MNDVLVDGFLCGLEKAALSKWKQMVLGGKLSGAAKDKLLKKYVDPERMVAGLNRGSDNVFKRHGTATERTTLLGRVARVTKGELPIEALTPYYTRVFEDGSSRVLLPKGFGYNHLPGFVSGNPFPIKWRSSKSMTNRYIDTLGVRHEADEVLAGTKKFRDLKRKGTPFGVWKPNDRVAHFSPGVVMRESDNVTFSPKGVWDRFAKVRRKITGETQLLKDVGFGYGQKSLRGAQRRKAVERLLPSQ